MLARTRQILSPDVLAMVYLLLASIWFVYRDVQFIHRMKALGIEANLCKKCYAKNAHSFFKQSFLYLFILISMIGYVYVAIRIAWTQSSGPFIRFAAFEVFRLAYNFVTEIHEYYTLPSTMRTLLTPALFKIRLRSHFYGVFVLLLLLWNPKRRAGYKGLLRNAFGALLISVSMTLSYFYCLSAFNEKLIPGVDFQIWFDIERGYIDAAYGFHGVHEGNMR